MLAQVAALTLGGVAAFGDHVRVWLGRVETHEIDEGKWAEILRRHDADHSNSFSLEEMLDIVVEIEKELHGSADSTSYMAETQAIQAQMTKSFNLAHKDANGDVDMAEASAMISALLNKMLKKMSQEKAQEDLMLMMALAGLTLLLGTLSFKALDETGEWSMLDSFYFCMMTTSSVGLGDFTPKYWSGFTLIVWLVFVVWGLGLFTSILSKVQDVGVLALLFKDSEEGPTTQSDTSEAARVASKGAPSGVHVEEGATSDAETGGELQLQPELAATTKIVV
jgi:hypothetical protein